MRVVTVFFFIFLSKIFVDRKRHEFRKELLAKSPCPAAMHLKPAKINNTISSGRKD